MCGPVWSDAVRFGPRLGRHCMTEVLLLAGRVYPLDYLSGGLSIAGHPLFIKETADSDLGTGCSVWDGAVTGSLLAKTTQSCKLEGPPRASPQHTLPLPTSRHRPKPCDCPCCTSCKVLGGCRHTSRACGQECVGAGRWNWSGGEWLAASQQLARMCLSVRLG